MTRGDGGPEERLREAILARFPSIRAFAKHRTGKAQPSHKEVENRRNEIQRWLRGKGMEPETARAIEAELGKPAGYFDDLVIDRRRGARAAEVARLAALEERVAALEEQRRDVRGRRGGAG